MASTRQKGHIVISKAIGMYTIQHLTMAEIGQVFGVSRAAVCKALRRAGIAAVQGEHVETTCAFCGNPLMVRRGRWRRTGKQYCTQTCYAASRENPNYIPWRQGQNIARALVRRHFALAPGMIVHHHDGDNFNNAISNLAVIANQADHLRLHHGKPIMFLWDGRNVRV